MRAVGVRWVVAPVAVVAAVSAVGAAIPPGSVSHGDVDIDSVAVTDAGRAHAGRPRCVPSASATIGAGGICDQVNFIGGT